ncbi:MAG TPA: MnhB domain-containing protein [Clostridia bacterium]|nr:MnhB domain-containing protein [Clostridia bacterium]
MKNEWFRALVRWIDGEPAHDRRIRTPEGQRVRRARRAQRTGEQFSDQAAKRFAWGYRISAVVICLSIVCTLLYTVFQLPLFGAADSPANNEVVERYIEKGVEETGAVNFVTGMILDYRAFDTFGESSVLFLAVTSVLILLLRDKNNISEEEDLLTAHEFFIEREMQDLILQKVVAVVMPCILLFGIYVVLNGHISPGGGFSGGAIMGGGLILYGASFGILAVRRFFNRRTFTAITTAALLTYAASKAYSFFTGANGLETGIPLGTPGAILSSGLILVLDICVGAVVTCTMYGFYALFARGRL